MSLNIHDYNNIPKEEPQVLNQEYQYAVIK